MKRILLTLTALILGITTTQAAVIHFGAPSNTSPNWNTPSKTVETDGSITFSQAQDGVTFDLNVAGYNYTSDADILGTATQTNVNLFANGAGAGISGGASNYRVNKGQYAKFTISISSGAEFLSSLSFTNLNIRYEGTSAGLDNRTLFDNSGNSVTYINGNADPIQNYSADTITSAGLNQLTLATTNTWALNYALLLPSTDGVTALGQVSFAYELDQGTMVTNYTGTLKLGTGEMAVESYLNTPAVWDTTSALWGVGPFANQSAWTNWIDGSDAIFEGTTTARYINLASTLDVSVDELEWDGDSALWFTGNGGSTETITINNQLRTAIAKTSRWIYFSDANVGGSFDMQNVGRLLLQGQGGVSAETEINILDNSAISFNGEITDFNDLSVTANGSVIFNQSAYDKTLGSLSGNGALSILAGTTLTINDITVGGISNVASITADSSSAGNLQMGSGTHIFTLNPDTSANDLLEVGPGTLTFGGDLIVNSVNTNLLNIGDSFQLFDAGAYAGSFNSIVLPTNSLPAGTTFFMDDLGVDGTVSVGPPGYSYKLINFTDFIGSSTWEQRLASTSGSITNGAGTILTLTLSVVEHDAVTVANGYGMFPYSTSFGGITRTTEDGGNNIARLDSFDATPGVTNTANDEIMKLELSISGTPVDSLSLKDLRIDSLSLGEIAEFNDGNNTTNTHVDVGGSDIVSYDDVLAGLTELNKDNVESWKLEVASRDNNTALVNTISFDEFRFSVGYLIGPAYEAWAGGWSADIGDENNDYEPDGMNNLLEYALGGDPTRDDAASIMPNGFVEDDSGTDYLYYVHNQRTDDNTLTYTVGTKTDLVTDTALNTGDVEPAGEGRTGTIISITNRTVTTEAAKFIGLEVSK